MDGRTGGREEANSLFSQFDDLWLAGGNKINCQLQYLEKIKYE